MRSPVKIVLFVIVASLFYTFDTCAQIWLSNEAIYNEAEEYLNAEEYIEALPLYLLLEKKEITNANIYYKIGICYLNIRGKKVKSIPYLEMAVENSSSEYVNEFSETKAPVGALMELGIAYRINGQLSRAVIAFNTLKDSIGDRDPDLLAITNIQLERCENAKLLGAFPGEPRTERLPSRINNQHSNYNPVLVNHDDLLFYMEELPFYDAVMRVDNIDGEWEMPENISPKIHSDGDHILVGADTSGNQLFLHFYEPLKMGEIYTTRFTNDGWEKPKPLNDNINTPYNETHASLSTDGSTLYFTSNRPGGQGGLDIYKSNLTDSFDWGPAINLGTVVNTPFNEESPIINSDDNILYFSSQGHLNMGGYDVFYTLKRDEERWRQPINMGSPVSTTDDDLFYYPLEGTVSGLMSRLEKPDAWGYDIYRYNSMVFANSPRFNVRGKAEDADTTNYTEYRVKVINNQNSEEIYSTIPGPDGYYDLILPSGDFGIEIIAPDGTTSSLSELSLTDTSDELTQVVYSPQKENDTVTDGRSLPEFIIEKLQMDTVTLDQILFTFDNFLLPGKYSGLLNQVKGLMNVYPSLTFTIQGHTDAIGSDSYNESLSRKRAQSVLDYLVRLNADPDRLYIEAKGESEPVAINSNMDGSDNPEGRAYNRRVTIVPTVEIPDLIFIRKQFVPVHLQRDGVENK
jgi:outer membrane protein OmpA-like peptidoglycan-associated protein